MQLSSALCRAQEAHHRTRAAGAELENVRNIANSAAAAWGLEALSAERREARNTARATATLAAAETGEDRERRFSENPDRGFESP